MNDVSWRLAEKPDRRLLESFTCCPADHPPRLACDQPWAHEVQTYFRRDAIRAYNRHNAVYDQRLLLVLEGPDLVGAAVHALTDIGTDADALRERTLVAYAVGVDYQGKSLSDGRRASAAVLDAAIMDISSRHGEGQVVVLHAFVRPANEASRTALSRHGVPYRHTNGDFMVHSARIS
ncbi:MULTISPECIES: hypothetical protein [Streptomyces]|uniref:hypothetical protein n=1 Tax=Streptomyces TaxID=1883 RepID=UPI00367B54C6